MFEHFGTFYIKGLKSLPIKVSQNLPVNPAGQMLVPHVVSSSNSTLALAEFISPIHGIIESKRKKGRYLTDKPCQRKDLRNNLR